jgi:HD-GYP domain-containing protein (c-di-GMP phosphodiesterase class II)
MGLPEEEIEILRQGALMHDLGKIAIPDAILNKPDKLTEEEFSAMRSHPEMTANIMRPLRRFNRHREIASWHHERWDGYGYPDGLKGENIPILARIVAIADTWDAMTGDRVYRKGMSVERALGILEKERNSGQWDPSVVDAFLDLVRKEGTQEPAED